MTHEEKQILLKDLCARLPYGVIINYFNIPQNSSVDAEVIGYSNGFIYIDNHSLNPEFVRPYLRLMSSMTEEEKEEYKNLFEHEQREYNQGCRFSNEYKIDINDEYRLTTVIDWLNEHHFDYRGLISMWLALEAPEDMYKEE